MFSLDLLNLFHKLTWRINTAFCTFPTIKAWLITTILLFILTLFCLPIGLWRNFLKVEKLRVSQKVMLSIIAGSLLSPAISEELFFSSFINSSSPRKCEDRSNLVLGKHEFSTFYYLSSTECSNFLFYRTQNVFSSSFFVISGSFRNGL